MNQQRLELIQRLKAAMPTIKGWIDATIKSHQAQAVPVSSLGFDGLPQHLPQDLLERTKVVTLHSEVPFPPLSQLGLPEFAPIENQVFSGVTYNDTFFVRSDQRTESLHLHELVHVIQWETLGVDAFLLAYGYGLMTHGYRHCPLEEVAYILQANFENGKMPPNVVEIVQQRALSYWQSIAPMFGDDIGPLSRAESGGTN